MSDAAAILPSWVTVAFRKAAGNALTGGWHPITVALNALNPALIGNGGTKTFHNTAQASFAAADAPAPENLGALTALAVQIARDYYNYLSGANLDIVYAGIVAVEPEGLHDIEWTYREDMVKTRVLRSAWNHEPEELLHSQLGSLTALGSSSSSGAPGVLPGVPPTDCPPGFVQQQVVVYVACDLERGLVVVYDTICVPFTGGQQ